MSRYFIFIAMMTALYLKGHVNLMAVRMRPLTLSHHKMSLKANDKTKVKFLMMECKVIIEDILAVVRYRLF